MVSLLKFICLSGLISLTLSLHLNSAFAKHLYYEEVTETKFTGAMAKFAQFAKTPNTVTKHYISYPLEAIVSPGEYTQVINFDSLVMTYMDHKRKTYYTHSLGKSLVVQNNEVDKTEIKKQMKNFKINIDYTNLKKKKKYLGKICHLYKVQTNTKMQKGISMANTSTECYQHPAPAAILELNKKKLEAFKKMMNGKELPDQALIESLNIKGNFDKMPKQVMEGFKLYSITSSEMPLGVGPKKGLTQGLPKMTTKIITKVTKLSEKKFSHSIFKLKKGYKKEKPSQ